MIISLLKVVTAEDKTMHLNAEMELEEFRTKAGRFPIVEKEPVEFVIRHVKNRQVHILLKLNRKLVRHFLQAAVTWN